MSFATITGAEWKEILPKMYVWFDYMSMPQPNASAVGAHGTGAHGFGAHGTGAHGFDFGPTLKRKVTLGAHGTGAHGTGADHRFTGTDLSIKLAMAVRSIPAYVEHATYMIVLAPVCAHADLDMTCSFGSWRTRGWCRMELMAADLDMTCSFGSWRTRGWCRM